MHIMHLFMIVIGQALFMLGLIHSTITMHPATMFMTGMGVAIVLAAFYSIARN